MKIENAILANARETGLHLVGTGHLSRRVPGGYMVGDRSDGNGSPFQNTARVSQAAGMVSVQAGCDVERALTLIRNRAAESGVTIDELASRVIDGSIRFDEADPRP